MKTVEDLKQRLGELEKEIAETRKRLPAHSVKPPVMMDLLRLEDEYDAVLNEMHARQRAAGLSNEEES